MMERLQKIIARAGITSRRHAEQLILSGQVRVNGRVVTELGAKANAENDRIEAAGRTLLPLGSAGQASRQAVNGGPAGTERMYLVLHKPPHVVATLADPQGRPTLRHCLRGLKERVYPVGRLGYAASGLVFMTNDGDLAAKMLEAARRLPQTYQVKIKGRLDQSAIEEMERLAGARIQPIKQPEAARRHMANCWYEVKLAGARRDILRKRLAKAGHRVEKMKRVALGPVELGSVPQGRFRRLEAEEVRKLRRALEPGAQGRVRVISGTPVTSTGR
jgi:23S rRNA pseudouridine2605 synthase